MEVMILIGFVLFFAPLVITSLVYTVWLIMDSVEKLRNGDIEDGLFILFGMCMIIGLLLMLIVGGIQVHHSL